MTTIVAFDSLGHGFDMTDRATTSWLLDDQAVTSDYRRGASSWGYEVDARPMRSVFFSTDARFSDSTEVIAIRTYLQEARDVFNNPAVQVVVRVTNLLLEFMPSEPNIFLSLDLLLMNDQISGNGFADILRGGEGNDYLRGLGGGDLLLGELGNDTLQGGAGSNILIGGDGDDLALVDGARNQWSVFTAGNWTLLFNGEDAHALKGVENVTFDDALGFMTSALASGAARFTPSFARTDLATNAAGSRAVLAYDGPVEHLVFTFLGSGGGEAVQGTRFADFINALAGDDAMDAGAGADVVDGGTGSNFITGGADRDVFFLDGRAGGTTWSTITDWQTGEQLSVWGWEKGVSTATWLPLAGAAGYQGTTMHADLDGDGVIETSVTWTNMAQGNLPVGLEFDGLLWFT